MAAFVSVLHIAKNFRNQIRPPV